MADNSTKKTIKETVLDKIKAGQAKMKPRWHFILKTVLAILGTIIVALTLLYLVSFILFVLRQSGAWFVPVFGFRGIGAFLSSLPWFLVVTAVLFFVLLEILVRRYSFGYRKPLLYSLLAIIIFVLIAGFFVSKAGLHQGLFKYAEEEKLPFAGPLYKEYGLQQFEQIHQGVISEITEETVLIENPLGETLTVVVAPETRFPLGIDFEEGDEIVVLGKRGDGTVQAFGIRKIEKGERPPFPEPGGAESPNRFRFRLR